MKTKICKDLKIEYPIFAFTHCRDVVVAVSKAGGFGVLGAVGFSKDQLKEELDWIDENIGDFGYGVDVVIPQKYEGMEEINPSELEKQMKGMIPQEHKDFVEKLLKSHEVPTWPDPTEEMGLFGWTLATAMPLVEEALTRPKCKMIANALGTPPKEVIDKIKSSGRVIAALCGKTKQAISHKEAGVDLIIAQGYEGGGHTGEIGSMVLWPEIIKEVSPTPVLAAGGIGSGDQMLAAMSMGAEGIWTGSIWLAVQEAFAQPAQKQSYFDANSGDTVRSRSWTGKPARMLKNLWTEAWDKPDTPEPLGMPLQGLVTADAMRRTHQYAGKGKTQQVALNPIGQIVGQINEVESCKNLINRLVMEYLEALEKVNSQIPKV
ncbi:uncharacterized protein METZ01_LOCUS66780 [marine metagenome]|uniref:Uncharacterized protein n=1 Tax=marine metagenome TaxID=408172 RepID=A0A381TCQ8_9ZZZZ